MTHYRKTSDLGNILIQPYFQSLKFAFTLPLIALTISLNGCQIVSANGQSNHSAKSSILPTTAAYSLHVTRDIAYGQDARQKLDIYTPADNQQYPVLIFVYGGSWQSGSRQKYAFIGRQFAKAGYTTVVIDYRLAPQSIYPDYVIDTAQAMNWVFHNIAQYGGNPEQLFVMGHSAGAFNAIAAVDDKRFWSKTGIPDKSLLGVIGLAGPYDYDFRLDNTQIAFPKNATREQVMPVYHLRPSTPPHLLVTGSKDTLVHSYNTDSLQKALQNANGKVERIEVPASHAGVVASLSKPLKPFYPTFNQIHNFMQRKLAETSH